MTSRTTVSIRWPMETIQLHRFLLAPLLAALAVLIFAFPEFFEDVTAYTTLEQSASQELDQSLNRNLASFAAVSGIKAVLAIVEDSTIGVGFSLQIGDIIEPAYDFVDWIWEALLYALIIQTFYKLILDTNVLTVGYLIIAAGILLVSLSLITPFSLPRRLALLLIFLGISVVYILPCTLHVTQFIGNRYLQTARQENLEQIALVAEKFDTTKTELFKLRGTISLLRPIQSVESIKEEMIRISSMLSTAVSKSVTIFLTQILLLAIELFLLPISVAFTLYKTASLFLRSLNSRLLVWRDASVIQAN